MRYRRSGRDHLSDIFYNVGDMNLGSVDDRLGFTREFTDATQDRMLRDERLEREHRMEEERRREAQYPSCRITDRPYGWHAERSRPSHWDYDRDRPPRDYTGRRPEGYDDRQTRW
ncbi:hypothetical protein [Pontibacter cellulosilyticus]|uniref:Uncharacterized protein n=1 Tax=Pontibacter cellulosilyticus TaxID=1720253 RepID=A0A923N9E4_9BACT|nr:hypothetical protein [Pontibacter cellulosilyticus]MBC5992840.1 hypothetical protein [Pontibacter cellulosilyticus]